MPKETSITDSLIMYIISIGGMAKKKFQNQYQIGEPDIDACINGRCIKIETKRPGKKSEPEQLVAQERWRKAGALVWEIHSKIELQYYLCKVGLVTDNATFDKVKEWMKQKENRD